MRIRHLVTLALAAACAASVSGQKASSSDLSVCPGGPSAYLNRAVADLRVTSPFDFIQAVRTLEDRAKESLQLKKGDSFDANAYSAATAALSIYIRTRLPSSLISFRLVVVHGALEPNEGGPPDCSSGPVVVHYHVFTAVIPRTSANLSEIAQGLTERPSGNAGALSSSGLLKILPNVNYNQTRRVFAGLSLNQALPFKVFDHFEADPAISPDSTTGTVELTGSANPAKKYLNNVNWEFGTQYYDVPVDSASVTKGLLSAEAFASTKELASTITFRWGGEVAGGHVQDSTGDTANSSYGEVKLLAGLVAQHGNVTSAATYGLEVGRPISRPTGTFEKQIFDARFGWTYAPLPKYVTSNGKDTDDRLKYIGTPHHPLTIEAQVNAGVLSGSAAVPNVERFFGGNQAQPFIPGQPWDALEQPYIRSIPENRLGAASGTDVIGGNRFYSANLTIAKAIFGKALVPRDLADEDFINHLDSALKTAKGELSDAYYSKDPGVSGVSDAVGTLDDDLAALKKNIAALPPALMNQPNVKPIKSELNGFLIGARAGVALIKSGHASVTPNLINTQLPGLQGDLDRLSTVAKAAGDVGSATAIQQWKNLLNKELGSLKLRWGALDTKGAREKADTLAETDLAPAKTVLNRLLYTLNSYSVAPVAIFDVARLWPEQQGTRYAPGGGVRLSIVNANFTFGYAYNPTQANHEGAGAVFFKLDFTDLFR